MEWYYKPLPSLKKVEGWQSVEIIDTEEPLVSLSENVTSKIIIKPMYFLQEIPGASEVCYVRKMVARKLAEAAQYLPDGYFLVVWDGFRPIQVQENLYEEFYHRIKNSNPAMEEEDLVKEVTQFVSLPSLDPKKPSPHLTGGSVDVTIMDPQGNYLEMGTDFDDFSSKANTCYYEEKMNAGITLMEKEEQALLNRRHLYWLMSRAGFTNYTAEWWHFDYGNQWWALLKGNNTAHYGLANIK